MEDLPEIVIRGNRFSGVKESKFYFSISESNTKRTVFVFSSSSKPLKINNIININIEMDGVNDKRNFISIRFKSFRAMT